MSDAQAAISLDGVGVYYYRHSGVLRLSREKFWALQDISLAVQQGEVLGVVGRNGAGKSTLMKVLARLIEPDRGRLVVRSDLRVTLLSLQAGFKPHLSGRDNILLSGMLLGMRRRTVQERLPQIIELADLGAFIDEPIRTYSSGMRARLGFATAYHTDTDVMLLDEILSVGDAEFSQKARALMEARLLSGKTVIMVSHAEHILKALCSRLIWIERGVVRADGATDEVWTAYRAEHKPRGHAFRKRPG